jgi:hypothetical protein
VNLTWVRPSSAEANIFAHQPVEVLITQQEYAVQQVSSKTSDALLIDTVVARTVKGSEGSMAFPFSNRRLCISSEPRVMIKQKESVRRRARPCLSHLLHDPATIKISCHVATQNLSPVETRDEIAIENAKHDCSYRKDEWLQLPSDSSGKTSACVWRTREILESTQAIGRQWFPTDGSRVLAVRPESVAPPRSDSPRRCERSERELVYRPVFAPQLVWPLKTTSYRSRFACNATACWRKARFSRMTTLGNGDH